ncbi:hypothetical protein PHYBLDRAFT_153684 [Phycomyces blakesleeanus NRRL 1555(-)]|uniref:Reverse transcriptase zinc-binding domain-containing protein n=1 Tax=Phycomyces blakesleeanus (strain ATCC 8743b / DSM 1359 / FGSC 10004 / NBRC 33097 / NRRL 1555) TaxID=763407 RepID=A0A162PFH4_PHYB8|nr:hypothetical protein PHYBLDRAFT_153684 [Phycomyces blakesleeanus NRRL 1555(-)]OAD65206.1 hypothetical protein PHYBLDRAFT_153684 [Phycomyces blakesleeanus NRRL 1555(-)]|eukprot:XP_018283246.1 hypothetical protein PHYBLDRAFT_153684 [Phycomyces blakesleeanus NRRL 1555(-)]
MHKTQAFSLSGSSLPDWNTFLRAYNVTDWHDRTSPTSLRYLGFPLFSSITQRDSYGTTLLSKIETFCSIHGSRSLSFRGWATIMNSLVLSQLWHVLRVVSFPSAFLDRVRSIVCRFFHVNSFPPIAFDTLCLPRLQGGLGILDPGIQQCALQLCWLKPLIRNPLLPHSLVPQWFSTLLRSDVPTVDPLLLLLFPDCRPRNLRYSGLFMVPEIVNLPGSLARRNQCLVAGSVLHSIVVCIPHNHRTLDSLLHLVLKAMDTLPRNFDRVVLNLSSCLILPLSSMISSMPSHPPYRPAWRDLRVHHLYQIESNLDILTPITLSRPLPRSVTLNCILNRIRDHTMVLHPILFRACIPSFVLAFQQPDLPIRDGSSIDLQPLLSAQLPGQTWSRLTTRSYRSACSHQLSDARPIHPPLIPRQLRSFWSFALPHQAQNVWFRGLHNKLSCRALLYRIMPSTVSSPLCTICQVSIETQEHFLLACPLKSAVWTGIWLEFFGTVPLPSALSNAFQSFVFPPRLTLRSLLPLSLA